MKKIVLLLLLATTPMLAQVPPVVQPPTMLGGSVGVGAKVPFFNNGSVTMADADYTLQWPGFSASVIQVVGSQTAIHTLYAPATRFGFEYTIQNATSGGYAITVKPEGNTGATGVTIPNGQAVLVVYNGVDYVSTGTVSDAVSLTRSVVASSVTGTDAITMTTSPAFNQQTQPGLAIRFVPVGSNTTTSVTVAVNGMSALPVEKSTSTGLASLAVGDLEPFSVANISLDPTLSYWVLANPATATFVGGVPGVVGDLLFSSGTNTLFTDSGNAYYDLPSKVFYVPAMRLNSATDGYVSYAAGTGTLPALAANSTGFSAPPSGGTPGLIKLPGTLSAGVLTLSTPATANGVNQSQASITPMTSIATPNAVVQTNSAGVVDPSFFIAPSLFKLEDNFCFGFAGNSGTVANGWVFTQVGSVPVTSFLTLATYPYPCGIAFRTAAAATAGQGAYMTMAGSAGPAGVGNQLPDLEANAGWSHTWIFKTPSIANTAIVLGLTTNITVTARTNAFGMFLRYDPISPYSNTPNSSVVCTATACTVTSSITSTPLANMSVTLSGVACPTRSLNGTFVTTQTNSTTTFAFDSSGAAETCGTPGNTTSNPETTYKLCNHGTVGTLFTCVDTGVAADTNVHKIVMASSVPGTMVYTLDARAPITISTNMPLTSTFTPTVSLLTNATAQVEVDLYYFNFIWPGLPR